MIRIRKATIEDAEEVASYLFLAMEEIVYKFIGVKDAEQAQAFLMRFAQQEDNQYSYCNCFVAELNGELVAAANVYDGASLYKLRQPVVEFIRSHYNPEFYAEDETGPGEQYIDCLAVHPQYQGKGMGSAMLRFLIGEYVVKRCETLGLLVDEGNPNARKLYLRSGFVSKEIKTIFGNNMEHMQKQVDAL